MWTSSSKPPNNFPLLEMYCRAFLPNWTQNPPFFAELTHDQSHFLRVLAESASNIRRKKKQKKKKICRSNFRFFCFNRKSRISWVEKLTPNLLLLWDSSLILGFRRAYLICPKHLKHEKNRKIEVPSSSIFESIWEFEMICVLKAISRSFCSDACSYFALVALEPLQDAPSPSMKKLQTKKNLSI